MRRMRTIIGPACTVVLLLAALTACGDDTKLPEAPSSTPFKASTVAILQTGNAPATIDTSSVTFVLDDTRSLVAHLTVRSTANSSVTVTIRGSVYDPQHSLVDDLTGGQVNVTPGSTTAVELTGPTPLGTIASATFEVSASPSPA